MERRHILLQHLSKYTSFHPCFETSQPRTRIAGPNLFVKAALLITICRLVSTASAQAFASNGQFFTKGLAISDAPSLGSPQHAGSNLVIAVDLSGDGKIDQNAFSPGSGASNSYNSLEIYLVSSQTNSNFTVANGSGLLNQEPGSTVKHLNFPLPSCIPAGSYNLTYYEGANIDGQPSFSITPISVTVDNPKQDQNTGPCNTISNALQNQPQTDTAPTLSPYLNPDSSLFKNINGTSNPSMPTITVGSAGLPTQWTIESSGATVTVTGSESGSVTTATMVVISTVTQTETQTSGMNSVFTTTEQIATTITAIMGTGDITAGGFFPVNGERAQMIPSCIAISLTLATLFFFLV